MSNFDLNQRTAGNNGSSVGPTLASLANRKQAFARDLTEMDYFDITGSTDLAGEPKPRIPHQRGQDKAPLVERYDMGKVLGQ